MESTILVEAIMLFLSIVITTTVGVLVAQNKKVLANQQKQEVSMAEIKKDIDALKTGGKDTASRLDRLDEEVKELKQDMAIVMTTLSIND